MSWFIIALIAWMVPGMILQWRIYKRGLAPDVLSFFKLPSKLYTLFPLIGTVAWPGLVYYMAKKKD